MEVAPLAGSAAAANLLTGLDVGVAAVVILHLAGVLTGRGRLGPGVRLALLAVLGRVNLEGLVLEVLLEVVAANNGQTDTTDGIVSAVAKLGVGRLLADVGRLRNTRRGRSCGQSSRGFRCGLAHVDCGCGLGLRNSLRLVLVQAFSLAALVSLARRRAVCLDVAAPCRVVPALENAGPARLLEARRNLDRASAVGSLAVVLILPVGQRWGAPFSALVFALVGDNYRRSVESPRLCLRSRGCSRI